MELEFKPVVAGDIDRLRPFYGLRPNKTCDSVFLDSFLWKDYYHVQCAVSEGRAVLWLMEKDGQVSTAMPLCMSSSQHRGKAVETWPAYDK